MFFTDVCHVLRPAATALAAAEREKENESVSPYQDRPDTPGFQQRHQGGLFHSGSDENTAGDNMELAYQAQKMA